MTSYTTNHYGLTKGQRDILKLLYAFRFATSKHIGQILHISKRTINKRLLLMTELGYLGRKYDSNYKLHGKLATYYLLPKGIDVLKALDNRKYSSRALRNVRKDPSASDQFIERCLGILEIYCYFKARYGDCLRFLTASQLAHKYDYFEDFTPAVYLQLVQAGEERDYFLEFLQASKPYRVIQERIRQHLDYAGSGAWEAGTDSDFPVLLFVCNSRRLRDNLLKRAETLIGDMPDAPCLITFLDDLATWRDLADPTRSSQSLDAASSRA